METVPTGVQFLPQQRAGAGNAMRPKEGDLQVQETGWPSAGLRQERGAGRGLVTGARGQVRPRSRYQPDSKTLRRFTLLPESGNR